MEDLWVCFKNEMKMMLKTYKLLLLVVGMMTMVLSSCSVSRHLSEGEYLLDKVKVISEENQELASSIKSSVRQHPNTRFLGLFRLPLGIYCLAGNSDNAINNFLKKTGEPPRVYDSNLTDRSCDVLEKTLVNRGYLNARVDAEAVKRRHKVKVNFYVHPGRQYRISSVDYQIRDSALMSFVTADAPNSWLKEGRPFDVNKLNDERTRIVNLLHDEGYYTFKKDDITYVADTARNSTDVDLTVRVRTGNFRMEDGQRVRYQHKPYTIGKVNYQLYPISYAFREDFAFTDSLDYENNTFVFDEELLIKPKVLYNASLLRPGMKYNASDVADTYGLYGRLGALKYTNINFVTTSDSTLDCNISLFPAKKVSLGAEVDLTNTAGDFGASLSLAFTNRNLFRGSETFMLKLRGAYENISQLSDYESKFFVEYGADMSLNFPRFIVPFINDEIQRRSKATTQLDLQFNTQDRPEFDRDVFSASWSYLWNSNPQIRHRMDLLGVNLVSVPRKDKYFIENYLSQYNSRNSIMKFNYEDLFIFRSGYDFYYTSPNAGAVKNYFDISHSVHAGVEASGNLLYTLSNAFQMRKDTLGQYRLFNIAYAQYVKGDVSWTMNMNFDRNNSLLFHVETGVAFPYGNTRMLPFEKRYYAGGANSVRGWRVRGLGPGRYVNGENTIDYINQSGDIKLDLSLEYRMHIFWKFNGALFVDAGNIWTIYDYDDQPGGVFMWDKFYKQIAVSYGAGLRLDLNFLILRFDMAMKAINPVYLEGPLRYPLLHPKFNRDFAWHFAVGYPF